MTLLELEPFLDTKRTELLAAIRTFGAHEQALTEYEGGWNVANIVEHLIIIEQKVIEEVDRLFAIAPVRPSEPLEAKDVDITELFRSHGLLGGRKQAPPETVPTGLLPLEDGLTVLGHVRQELKGFIPLLFQRETNSIVSVHPLGVELNVCQWVLFSAFHEWAHIHQLKRIRQRHSA
ncbi:DinB family protein [Paenibacillus cremeus]|uniref:DinB family protein n=1 Tax=Paenibacillus cremeus TaxID=2163881 RepID=A0A559KA79_9BACL|nr:DinB family protein [Paenibacillus cremeus]